MVKEKIPKTVKNSVWITYMGKQFEGKCFCCESEIINVFTFICGHVISEKCGGKTTCKNMRPICSACNGSMGIKSMMCFMEEHGFNFGKFNETEETPIKTSGKSNNEAEEMPIKKSKNKYGEYELINIVFAKDQLMTIRDILLLKCVDKERDIIDMLIANFLTSDKLQIIYDKYLAIKHLTKNSLKIKCRQVNLPHCGVSKPVMIRELVLLACDMYAHTDSRNMNSSMPCNIASLSALYAHELKEFKYILGFECNDIKREMTKMFVDNWYTSDRLSNVKDAYKLIKGYPKRKLIDICAQNKLFNSGLNKDQLITEYLRHMF